ncbi:SfnB family sulfur acquisition oxidoreductase [Morganella morganii]|uniref:Dibenzothiophene monooxygenase n=1 Tax=Morganella morganii TaxID=582 RepID=A0A433ZWR1_MORMO|nr:SfnB family sulfur acquisition oxidoreductase [Morganella morganii]RUT66537.1 SfnB family sulfur acquisition oxidoreductase [Morganella morganii]
MKSTISPQFSKSLSDANDIAQWLRNSASERDQTRHLSTEQVDAYAASGLWAVTVPREHGGLDLGYKALSQITRLIAAADPSIAQIPRSHFHIVDLLNAVATPSQKKFFFGEILAGKKFAQAASEIGGKNAADIQTTLTEESGSWRLNGKKFYATGCIHADWIGIVAKGDFGIFMHAFVPKDAPGMEIKTDWSGFGQKVTASGTVLLDNVVVNEEHIIPFTEAFLGNYPIGAASQLIHASIDVGIARESIDEAIKYIKQTARPWIDSGAVQASDDPYLISGIGDLEIHYTAACAMLDQVAGELDETDINTDGELAQLSVRVGIAKVLASEIAILASNKLFEFAGAGSTRESLNLHRHWRNARTHTLHDPVRWKVNAIGQFYLNDVYPKRHNYI